MAWNVKKNGSRNSRGMYCKSCRTWQAPGHLEIWCHRGTWYGVCASGCGCKAYSRPQPPAQPVVTGVLVDVQKPDGSMAVGYLLADGTLVTRQ